MVTSSSADQAGFRYLCVIATEASNLLPLFYRLHHSFTLDSCFRSVAATTLAPTRFLKLYRASLRIGLRCSHSPRCRIPARISGKDFPLPSHAGSNQPSLMLFFFFFLSSLSALHTPRSRGRHPILLPLFFFSFKFCPFRHLLGLRRLHPLLDRLFIGNSQRPVRHEALRLLCRLRCVSFSFGLSDSVATRERCFLLHWC